LKNYKNIEGVVASGATMVMKAPLGVPAEVPEVEGIALERGDAAVPAAVEVQPEEAPVAAATVFPVKRGLRLPLAVWLLSLLIVLGAGTAYYFLFFSNTNSNNSTTSVTTSQPTNPPATSAAPPVKAPEPPKKVEAKPSVTDTSRSTAAKSQTGELVVSSSPKGAKIYIDQAETEYGVTPMRLRLAVGSHTLSLKLDGMQPFSEEIRIKAGGKPFHKDVKLAKAASAPPPETQAAGAPDKVTVRVRTIPAGASVYVDDSSAGTSPISINLALGPHKVVVSLPDHKPKRFDIDLTADKPVYTINWNFDNP